MPFYVKQCPACQSEKIDGKDNPIKQCKSCGVFWFEPIPNSPQERLLRSTVREIGFGGAAGGSKSFGLILDATRQLSKENYNAILFRRTYKQLTGADGLVSLSKQVYPYIGGHYLKSEYLWEFSDYPGTIRFAHLEHEKNLENYDGHQYAYIGFDELHTFIERMYLYMFSRNRSINTGIQPFTRSTFNPGGVGSRWIKKRFVDPGIVDAPKYFRRINGEDTETGPDDRLATPRLFIPSRLEDNPYLWRDGNSDYERSLNQLDDVDYRRKRFGDWDAQRTGRVYHSFTEANIGPSSSQLDYSEASFYTGHDFGAVNEAWGLYAKIGDKYYKVYEEILPEGTTEQRCAIIQKRLEGKKVITGWGGAPSEQQQRRDYISNGVNVRKPPIGDIEAQIRRVNQMFVDGTLVICQDMTLTIDQLDNCVRDDKEGIMDKSTFHHLDEMRYFGAGVSRRALGGKVMM